MRSILIADSGSSKTHWHFAGVGKSKKIITQGLGPYFLTENSLQQILRTELLSKLTWGEPDEIFFYGTGCSNPTNVRLLKNGLRQVFPGAKIQVSHDLLGTARALCGDEKGVACILGTGSNSCYFDGKRIKKNSPGLGFILGDEGSGTHLGRKVLQHYLYGTFEADLMDKFEQTYPLNRSEILDAVYKKPFPNRFLAGFVPFLSENRGHFMIENILEDSFNDFFFTHIYKYRESQLYPIHFSGGVAYEFKDVIVQMCSESKLQPGKILKDPMSGLLDYHKPDRS